MSNYEPVSDVWGLIYDYGQSKQNHLSTLTVVLVFHLKKNKGCNRLWGDKTEWALCHQTKKLGKDILFLVNKH